MSEFATFNEENALVDMARTDFELLGLSGLEVRKLSLALVNISNIDDRYFHLAKIVDMVADREQPSLKLHVKDNELETLLTNVIAKPGESLFDKPSFGTTGLSHGFYRALTLNQMIELIVASRYCNELGVLIESEERTRKYKTKDIIYSDEERLGMFAVSGLVNKVGLVTGNEYSDFYYREIVKFQQPDVYFVNSGGGDLFLQEANKRGYLADCDVVVLPEVGVKHTSDFVRMGLYNVKN